jgi:transcriptional regulator with XRE-family HTH domain
LTDQNQNYREIGQVKVEFQDEWKSFAFARWVAVQVIGYRSDHNLSQQDFGKLVDVSLEAVELLESGESQPDPELLVSISEKTGIDFAGDTVSEDSSVVNEENDSEDLESQSENSKSNDEEKEDAVLQPDIAVQEDSEDEEYFDDDQFLNPSDDVVIDADQSAALIKQYENVITWKLEGFYNEDGTRKSRLSLKASPPMLSIESSNGEAALFVLTENVAKSLSEITNNVWRGYYGVGPKKSNSITQRETEGKMAELTDWVMTHKIQTIVSAVVILILIVLSFSAG